MTARRCDTGGLIDRARPLSFTFDGQAFTGFAGDTLASALLANGVRIVGRSFKYHRPRGVWSAWVDEPNAIFNVTRDGCEFPNCLATTTPLVGGMEARAVNAWPNAHNDIKGGLDIFHRFLGAGFYYKTFIWPDWHLFEPSIRKMAGLGAVSPEAYPDFVADQVNETCDALVIGGGPTGLIAARVAAEAGRDVILVDDHPVLGGSVYQLGQVEGTDARDWVSSQAEAIRIAGGRILTATTAFGVYDHNLVALAEERGFGVAPRLWRVRAGRTVLATGALDRPLTFPDNDKSGVMSLLGATEYLARFGVLAGDDLAVIATHSHAEPAIATLERAGARITLFDPETPGLRARGRKTAEWVETDGGHRLADAILTSAGLTPLVHLWRHAGGGLDWCKQRQAFLPGRAPEGMVAAGAANGAFDLDAALVEARAVGQGDAPTRPDTRFHITPHWPKPGSKGRQWIDFQHDVTLKDIETAARENYASVEHLKRYTTLGMASDQGKTSNMAGLAAMAALRGRTIPETGTTTFRPPYVPIPLEIYHGHHRGSLLRPLKRLPLEPRHRAADAALGEYGGWLRPGWYGQGDPVPHVQREARAARDSGGIFDGSPLGKIEVMGPDAEAFLNFVYYNTIRTLRPGAIRYGFMLTEGGIVYDDGVVWRMDDHRFLISCSSSHVDGVRAHLESWRQDGNDPDRIFVHDMTMQWATVTVTGPTARDLLSGLDLDVELGADAFPHMTFRQTTWQGNALRIARVSFSGDLSYELSVAARHAPALWDALIAAGQKFDVGPIGIEAMSILRAEKGYIIIGKDTDGETMPHDLGFGIPRTKKTAAFIGDRSLHLDVAVDPDRKTLVGLAVPPGAPPLPTGAHIVTDATPHRSAGYVTSSYHSPYLDRPVALALVERGAERTGDTVDLWHDEAILKAVVCDPCFYDPTGERLHA